MQRIVFESSPGFIVVCIAVGIGYAYLLYNSKHPWSLTFNRILFSVRAILAFLISFLLLGPIVKQITNQYERPVMAIVFDNSKSITEAVKNQVVLELSDKVKSIQGSLIDKGFETQTFNLNGEIIDSLNFSNTRSDINAALRKISSRYEGKNIAGVVLVSDGIYNEGLSPLYANYNFPIYPLGVGDTTVRADIAIKNLVYNKIAYQGNKFPLRVEVLAKGYPDQEINISLSYRGKVIDRQHANTATDQLLIFEFQPLASEQGIQRYDVQVEVKGGEHNIKNNHATAFVEVVEGRKKILMIAPAPHPDIKAIRSIVEKNSNYEFLMHIPGIEETEPRYLQPDNVDLAILHQSPDGKGKTRELFLRFISAKTPLFVLIGQQTDLTMLQRENIPIKFEQMPRQYDEVTPVINPAFNKFLISSEANSMFNTFPPVSVHFGKVQFAASSVPLLFQKVGSLVTEKPLLVVNEEADKKVALLLGEGIWRWRLHEYSRTENFEAFDEIFGKLIQYLSTVDDKSKFKSYPIEQEFSDTEAVVFESQVYNDIYEPIFGNTIDIEIVNETGNKNSYQYVITPGNTRYQIGGLAEGVYRYKSSTELNGKKSEVRGQFLVTAQQTELQNLTADFGFLRRLAGNTGGKFYNAGELEVFQRDLINKEASSIIHSEETYDSMINLKWVFFLLLLLVSAEWFFRKYFGGY